MGERERKRRGEEREGERERGREGERERGREGEGEGEREREREKERERVCVCVYETQQFIFHRIDRKLPCFLIEASKFHTETITVGNLKIWLMKEVNCFRAGIIYQVSQQPVQNYPLD